MTDEEFSKRCIESYSQYTCKDCNRYKESSCDKFPLLDVAEDYTCKSWEEKTK